LDRIAAGVDVRIRATNASRAQFLGLAFATTFLFTAIGDLASMGTWANHAFMFGQFVAALSVAGLARWTAFGRRHAAGVFSTGIALVSTSGGAHLSQFGGLDGPWFYGSYVASPVLIPLLMPLRTRLVATVATVGGFVAVYAWLRPGLFAHPMAHMPVAYLLTVSGISVALGEYVRRLEVESFADVERLEAAAELFEARLKLDDARPARMRHELARRLHDDVAQLITGARLHLSGYSERRAKDDVVARLGELLDELSRRSRLMLDELREPVRRGPLLEELERLRVDYAGIGLEVEVLLGDGIQPELLGSAHVDALVSSVRESLTNAVRHGGAREATVNVHGDPERICFDVVDAGGGASTGAVREGNGLRGIRERVAGLGGSTEVTRDESGFKVSVTMPLPRSA